MTERTRRLIAVLGLAAIAIVAAALGAHESRTTAPAASAHAKNMPLWTRGRELQRGQSGEENENTAAAEEYASRAFPADEITWDQTQTAMAAADKVASHGATLSPKWDAVGPTTLDVPATLRRNALH